ncbi:amidohydrolase, partial [bacterium]
MMTTIYTARRIVTMAEDSGEQAGANAFAVQHGRIVATGRREALALRFPQAEQVDFGDGVVIPGLN